MQWRFMLKESSHTVDSLSAGLSDARAQIRHMESVQVSQNNVEEVVNKKAAEAEKERVESEERVHEVAAKLNKAVADIETSIKNSEKTMNDHVVKIEADVKKLLE